MITRLPNTHLHFNIVTLCTQFGLNNTIWSDSEKTICITGICRFECVVTVCAELSVIAQNFAELPGIVQNCVGLSGVAQNCN